MPPSVVTKGEEDGGKETHTVKEEPTDDTVEQPERKKNKRPRVDAPETESKGSILDSNVRSVPCTQSCYS